MRIKKPTLFFSFRSTSSAMAAEEALKEAGMPGRLVPIPREITAGCGLAWMSAPENREMIIDYFKKNDLDYEDSHILEF